MAAGPIRPGDSYRVYRYGAAGNEALHDADVWTIE